MKLTPFKKLAAVSAVALSIAYAGGVIAAPYTIDTAVEIGVEATVDNTIDVEVTDIDFGNVGATRHATDTAAMTIDTDGDITDDPGGGYMSADPAALVSETGTGTAGTLTITDVLADQDVYITYTNFSNLTRAGGAAEDVFTLVAVFDDAGGTPSFSDGGDMTQAPNVIGVATADGTGDVAVINIGATIETVEDAAATDGVAYPSATYAGSFDVYISY